MKQLLLTACVMLTTGAMAQTVDIASNAAANFPPGTVVFLQTTDENGNPVDQIIEVPETPEMKQAKAKMLEEGQTYTLKVTLEPDENGENDRPFLISLMKDQLAGWNQFNSVSTFKVPAGEYTLIVAFQNKHQLFYDINLTEDTEMTLNADMATNAATAQVMLPEGEPLVMPTYLDGFLQENPYNCSYLYGMQNIQYKGFSRAVYSYSAGRGGPDYYKNNLRMATNVTSDEAVFVWDLLGCSNIAGYGANITRPASDIPADGVIRNDVSDYTKVSASFAETPAWNGNDIVKCVYRSYKPSNTILSELTFSFDTMLDYYLCAPVFTKGSYNAIMTLEKMQDDSYGIITPNLARCDGGFMCLDTQDGSPFSQTDPTGGNLQTNESFSFIPFEGMQPFGSSVPVCVTGLSSFMDKSWIYHKRFDLAGYYGNLGERLNIDRAYVKTTVNINGSETNFSDYQSYSDWFVANMKNLKGDIGFKFTTENILIDDIQGSNVCEVGFKTDNIEDLDYPTVQRLQFRNAEGLPTTRIDKAEGSTVNLYGDSYKFNLETKQLGQFKITFSYCKSFGADLTVEVAPTGTEDFVELEMTKDPTFSDPSYGSLWKADLGNLNVYSENGWFDMRITMWNANGEQRQTLTPAFYLADHKGDSVESIAKDNTLKLIDGTIVASNGAEVTVYTLSGARVANKNLSNGIYMARSNGNSAKILVK